MTHNSIFRKGFAFVPVLLGAVVVVMSAAVLFFGVQRVQDLQTVLQRPKAAETYCSSGSQPSCCNQIASGGGFDSCGWTDRGKCTLDQCAGSDSQPLPNCAYNSSTGQPQGPKNCNCGLLYRTYCQPTITNTNPCWTNQPVPKSFLGFSNNTTLSWEWDTTYSSTITYANAYVWTSSARTGAAYAQAGVSSPFTSLKVSDFSPALQANTTYYVKINPNGYYSPDPAKYQCMDTATAGWSFTTGTGSVECTTDSQCADDKKCSSNKCVVPACSPEPGVCQTAKYKNHACSLKNKDDGTVCETNKVCSNGACVSSEVNACWDNKGSNGKCYDCNGDGTINILDFSCFQKHWLKNVE